MDILLMYEIFGGITVLLWSRKKNKRCIRYPFIMYWFIVFAIKIITEEHVNIKYSPLHYCLFTIVFFASVHTRGNKVWTNMQPSRVAFSSCNDFLFQASDPIKNALNSKINERKTYKSRCSHFSSISVYISLLLIPINTV